MVCHVVDDELDFFLLVLLGCGNLACLLVCHFTNILGSRPNFIPPSTQKSGLLEYILGFISRGMDMRSHTF